MEIEMMRADNWTRWPLELKDHEEYWFQDIDFWYNFVEVIWWFPYLFLAIYWCLTYYGIEYMKDRQPVRNLQVPMLAYNLFVSLFSLNLLMTLWPLYSDFFSGPDWFYRSLCLRKTVSRRIALVAVAYTFSKPLHMADTLFLVLAKKPVPIFQLYHHSVMFFVPVKTLPYGEPIILVLGFTNIFQHIVTYGYFAINVLKIKMPRLVPKLLLLVELIQMIVGLAAGVFTIQVIKNGGYCVRHPSSINIFNFVYVSMFIMVLFMIHQHQAKHKNKKII